MYLRKLPTSVSALSSRELKEVNSQVSEVAQSEFIFHVHLMTRLKDQSSHASSLHAVISSN